MSGKENDENFCDRSRRKWLLVCWIGSFPKDAYDIINFSDIVFDETFSAKQLKVGCAIMVKCGKIKSPATVLQISDNTDVLYHELKRLQRNILSENCLNIIKTEVITQDITPKIKKRRYIGDIIKVKNGQHQSTQTEANENLITKLTRENQKLKAELYEANKTINSMCKDLNNIVEVTQKRMLANHSSDSFSGEDVENTPPRKIKRTSSLSASSNSVASEIEENDQVFIGSGKTPIPRYIYNQVNWLSFTAATRKLLMAIFSREILATHSLTGKPSPAFMGSEMPVKMRLDATKIADIVETVSTKCGVSESMVRSAITTKCADENKMFKKRSLKNEK